MAWSRAHLRRGSGQNSARTRVGIGQGDSGEFPGVEAELSRRLAGALVQRGGVAVAAQRSGAGRSWWRWLLGFATVEWEKERARGSYLYGGWLPWRARPRLESR